MPLYAAMSDVDEFRRSFPSAQVVRELLRGHGFVPMTRIGDGEHWVRRGRHVVLCFDGEVPCDTVATDLLYATIVRVGDAWSLAVD